MLVFGTLRACWPAGLAFTGHGAGGVTQRVARTLSAWSVSSSLTVAVLTALWGVLASLTSPRVAIAAAGIALLGTPLLLPRREHPHPPPPGRAAAEVAGRGDGGVERNEPIGSATRRFQA